MTQDFFHIRQISKQHQQNSCLDCSASHCFIKCCNEEAKVEADILRNPIVLAKNQIIFIQGTTAGGIYFVSSGFVKVTQKINNEKERVIRFAKKGDIIGHRGFGINKHPMYSVSATAVNVCSLCYFEYKRFYNLLHDCNKLSLRLMEFYSEELQKSEFKNSILSNLPVRERLAYALIELNNFFSNGNSQNGDGRISISRKDLANYIGTTRENVCNYLTEFKNDELIDVSENGIKVRFAEQLNRICNYCYEMEENGFHNGKVVVE